MHDSLGVILTAGGSSTRFGADKLITPLGDSGETVFSLALRAFATFAGTPRVEHIVVAVRRDAHADAPLLRELRRVHADLPSVRITPAAVGGASRAETVANALALVDPHCNWIAVHDAARPLVSHAVIERTLAAAQASVAAAPAVPVTQTIKHGGSTLPCRVERTIPRSSLWAMQTPQIIRRDALVDAYARCPLPLDQVTDDVQLIELTGGTVQLVAGEERNLKVTNPLDVHIANLWLAHCDHR